MPSPVSADHIGTGGFEPVRQNNFLVELEIGGQTIVKAQESMQMPRPSNPPIAVSYGNEKRKVAGVADFAELTLVLKDFTDAAAIKAIMAWHKDVYDPSSGKIGLAGSYKKQGTVSMAGPNGVGAQKWKLIGVWPSAVTPGEGNSSNNVPNTISVTLQVDKAILQ
jgi:hypothetical protein